MPRTSMRRLMPLNVSNADWICLFFKPQCLRARDHRQRVAHIQFADQIEVKLEAGNLKFRRRRTVARY